MPIENLLFVDTNIWLDFYRARNEMGLRLLKRAESQTDKIIVSFQLEAEFKRNRQQVILEGMRELKSPAQIPCLGIFSDANDTKMIKRHLEEVEKRAKKLRKRLSQALQDPTHYDPVYKVCQRIFHKQDSLNLQSDDPLADTIRRKAWKRFIHGYPPRKSNDTSIGDAFNWEWMVYCVTQKKSNLVIVSRDADYGVTTRDGTYVNDRLRQEFAERVGRKKKLKLFSLLSEALKVFHVPVSAEEEKAENAFASKTLLPTTAAWDVPSGFANALRGINTSNYNFLTELPNYSNLWDRVVIPDYSGLVNGLAFGGSGGIGKSLTDPNFSDIPSFIDTSGSKSISSKIDGTKVDAKADKGDT
jgi:hypothetical protein